MITLTLTQKILLEMVCTLVRAPNLGGCSKKDFHHETFGLFRKQNRSQNINLILGNLIDGYQRLLRIHFQFDS